MIPYFVFGPYGGLGDVIIQSHKFIPKINAYGRDNKAIIFVGDYITKFSPNYFNGLPKKVDVVPMSELHHNKDICRDNFRELVRMFGKSIGEELVSAETYGSEFSEEIPLIRPLPFWFSPDEFADQTIGICNFARTANRTVGTSLARQHAQKQYGSSTTIHLGKSNGELMNSWTFDHNLVNKTTVSEAFAIASRCDRLLCVDSAFMCYGMMTKKPMDIIITQPELEKYGFEDKSKRQGYFKCFDYDNVKVYNTNLERLA